MELENNQDILDDIFEIYARSNPNFGFTKNN